MPGFKLKGKAEKIRKVLVAYRRITLFNLLIATGLLAADDSFAKVPVLSSRSCKIAYATLTGEILGWLATVGKPQISKQELAQAYAGNSQYSFLKNMLSEKWLARFRDGEEAVSFKRAILARQWGGRILLRKNRLFAEAEVSVNQGLLRLKIKNLQVRGLKGEYGGFGTETAGLKTALAKILIGALDGLHAIAKANPKIDAVEFVADEIVNTKLAQAFSRIGFYSEKAGRRLNDEEIQAVGYFSRRMGDDRTDLVSSVTLKVNGTVHRTEGSAAIRIDLSDFRTQHDPGNQILKAHLEAAGVSPEEQADIQMALRYKPQPEDFWRGGY